MIKLNLLHHFLRGPFAKFRNPAICNDKPPTLLKPASTSNFHMQTSNLQSSKKDKEEMPDIFVQLLPIILPKEKGSAKSKILLCKWTAGVFEGRYTGMIKKFGPVNKITSGPSDSNLKMNLAEVAKNLLPSKLKDNLEKVELVGILRFDGPPDCHEYVYLGSLKEENIPQTELIDGDSNPCFWFDWDKIPFGQMPADDAIWYPEVLDKGNKVKGSFVFGGWSERSIKSYELSTVQEL